MTALITRSSLTGPDCLLVLDGEIDCDNADDVSSTAIRALDDPAVKTLTIDLAAVRFCDAAGSGGGRTSSKGCSR
jgi:anti-anti-sigma regulatory factor